MNENDAAMTAALTQIIGLIDEVRQEAKPQALLRAEQVSFANSELLLHLIDALIQSGALQPDIFASFAGSLRTKASTIPVPDQQEMAQSLENLAARLQACADAGLYAR